MTQRHDATPLLDIQGLSMHFPARRLGLFGPRRWLRAVDGVSLSIARGETLGLVGESGSGKSTVGNCILRLLEPSLGRILFDGHDLTAMRGEALRRVRPRLQAVFQDPMASLDPRMTVEKILSSPLKVNAMARGPEIAQRVAAIMGEVGLRPSQLRRYPHEFSGGQRQRIGVARALVTGPECIVFDEPTSALDVSVQAQILNLIVDLQSRHGYAYLFITHDLDVVRHVSHRIAVMYLGSIMETAPRDALLTEPRHPYTRLLIASAPRPDPSDRKPLDVIKGDVPSPVDMPPGCRFHPRCPEAMPCCAVEAPAVVQTGPGHLVACHLYSASQT